MLEHLEDPVEALRQLQRVVKPQGTFTVIEGDHGSAYFHPDDPAARDAIQALVDAQSGDANIGRRLYPVLTEAGLQDVHVSPRNVYVDPSRPELVSGFTLNTFTAMVAGVRETQTADQRRALRRRRRRARADRAGHLQLHVLQGFGSPTLSLRSRSASVACSSAVNTLSSAASFAR